MSEFKFNNPFLPFKANVTGGLGVGRKIKIRGKAEYKNEPRFCINFAVAPAIHENIAFHFSTRHLEKAIIITSMNQGRWGVEQRFFNPIHDKHHFELKIKVTPYFYEIHLDKRLLASIPFTVAPHMVNHIEIEGGVKIEHIHVHGKSDIVKNVPPAIQPMPMPTTMIQQIPMQMPMAPMPQTVFVQPPHMQNVVVVEPYYYHHGHHHHHHCH